MARGGETGPAGRKAAHVASNVRQEVPEGERMKFIACLLALALSPSLVTASGPIAVYALIDKVSFEPDSGTPDRVRISGVFIVAEQTDNASYSAPQRGYLYFGLPKANGDLARREWADLKSVAGTRRVVGFGSSWGVRVSVRRPNENHIAESPDDYPMGNGVVVVNSDQPRARALLDYQDR
jgi:hypothetical protein